MKTYQDRVTDVLLAVERKYMTAGQGILAIQNMADGSTVEDRDFALLAIDELKSTDIG